MSETTLHQYLWIAIAGGIVGFVYTFGIGANDVANACESILFVISHHENSVSTDST